MISTKEQRKGAEKSMPRILFGVFLVLHGLVHLLYFGQSARYFELQPGMVWPHGSWAFSRLLGNEATRNLASILLVPAALGLVAGGTGILMGQGWWRAVVIGSAVLSVVIFVLFWDGITRSLPEKGVVALVINLAILVALLVLRWSPLEGNG
jgi:hypothetical protein